MPEYKDSKSDIRIRGVLEIQSLSWLSSEGYDLLQGAIRERDGPNSGFTLATLYGNSSRARSSRVNAKIWIDSVKLMSAVYLLSGFLLSWT